MNEHLEMIYQWHQGRNIRQISRAAGALTFPSDFMLVTAMYPCPCGYFGSILKECVCTPPQIHRYLNKISGPLLDRIDIHIEVPEVKYYELTRDSDGEPSGVIAQRVLSARQMQFPRFGRSPAVFCNAQMGPAEIRTFCRLNSETRELLEKAIVQLGFSARAYDRILKVSRAIAGRFSSADILPDHVSEAVQYRTLDCKFWEGF